MTMFGSQWLANAGAGYEISQSIRFNDDDAAYLYRDNDAAQTDTKKFTYSVWIKRGAITGGTNTGLLSGGSGTTSGRSDFIFTAGSATGDSSNNDALKFDIYTGGFTQIRSEAKLRDPGAWSHIVLVYDAANSTANDTLIMYHNGSRLTLDSTSGVPNNLSLINANGQRTRVGADASSTPVEYDGYMAEINMIDGQALTPASFGETNDEGVWIPKKYSGAYGNNGFFIDGRDSSDLGDDESGNGNDFTSTGLAAADQMSDSPTNNHCTYNPLRIRGTNTLSDGNLQAAAGSAGAYVTSTFGVSSGKWYWEYTFTGTYNFPIVGIMGTALYQDAYPSQLTNAVLYYSSNGNKYIDSTSSSYGASYAVSDKIGVALNLDDNEITFFKNNSTQGAISISNREYTPLAGEEGSTNGGIIANFGQSDFEYTPPTGFKALNTSNLPATTITDGSAYFHPQLYTGNGSSGLAITNAANAGDFEPDLLIIAPRSNGDNKVWFDDVRGTTKRIKSNSADPGATDSTAQLTFESDGFDLDTTDVNFNGSGRTYVAWQWKKGATPGFDIVEYTGNATNRTISHSLGVAPEWIVIKDTSNTESWIVGHNSIGWTKNLFLNLTNAEQTSSTIWQDTAPTSSVFTIGTSDGINKSSGAHIAYLWASVDGFSKFGSYTGNGNADGPFVYTGFKPRWVMIKSTGTESWPVLDTARGSGNFGSAAGANGNNPTAGNDMNAVLVMSTSSAEEDNASGSRRASYLSNGFKVRTTNSAMNSSGQKYVYMAFAEHPFGGDGAAPATAR
jgi:hypothetical protein